MSDHDPTRPTTEPVDPEATASPELPDEAEQAWLAAADDDGGVDFSEEFDEDATFDAPSGRRGLTMRHPLLLVLVLAGAGFMFVKSWPKALRVINANQVADCGDLTERPMLRQQAPDTLPALDHDTYCVLAGVVESRNIYATGEPAPTQDVRKRDAGRKYFVKLNGDNVFGILAADRPDVLDFRLKKGSLLGFVVKGPGRLIDPGASEGFVQTERFLRARFRIAGDRPIRLYDTTDDPRSRWPYLVICVLMLLTAGLSVFGLVRLLRERLADRAA